MNEPLFKLDDVRVHDFLYIPYLVLEPIKTTTLVGESGGGKTTILRLLNKMSSPTQGTVYYQGTDLKTIDPVTHRRNVVMLSQSPVVFDGTIRENLLVGIRFQEKPIPSDEQLRLSLAQVSLKKSLDGPTKTLSGGEKQRLSLARILLLDPPVFLLDEPSSALDDITGEMIIQMLISCVRDRKKTIIMVTHSRKLAETYSDEVIGISNGTRGNQ